MGAAYVTRLGGYSLANADAVLGKLVLSVADSGISTQRREQIHAWTETLQLIDKIVISLKNQLPDAADWFIIFEYEIPRRARRPDIIILARDLIFVIEFKIGGDTFHSADRWQVRDYALNLHDFHGESKDRTIIPVLVASRATESSFGNYIPDSTRISPVQCFDMYSISSRIEQIYTELSDATAPAIDAKTWINSPYRPTPTIVEAAQLLFRNNQVAEISHSFATNLTKTTQALVNAIADARDSGGRTICFVTGIPGAGKTLAGLNAAHDPTIQADGRSAATFLSGNGPLIAVIHESLVRDAMLEGMRRQDAEHRVSAFIHDGHRFMQEHGINKPTEPPPEHIVIFDEAQRAWDAAQMKKKRDLNKSEADLIFDIMERAPSWAVVIALVGGGQEINAGEAGLEEWGRALQRRSVLWNVMASPETLVGGDATAGHRLFHDNIPANVAFQPVDDLHLASNVRSARAQWLGSWVNKLLAADQSNDPVPKLNADFPFVITRSLEAAKKWARQFADPKDRIGLLASSGGLRLRPSVVRHI
jgi:hypothetical protein